MYLCPACQCEIPEERIAVLRELKYDEHRFYCVKHAVNKPVKAIYSGENGTSELIICDRVDNDNVRVKFYDPELSSDTIDEESPAPEIEELD
jgi:hypothetical protein